jgi:NADH-quinone oxidoreductase subunit J
MNLDIALLIVLLAGALWTVLAADLLKSAIGLAVTSVVLAILMFRLLAPLAAVFELSVCAGLITVVFISVISLTRPGIEKNGAASIRLGKFIVLPLLVLGAGLALLWLKYQPDLSSVLALPQQEDMRRVLWGERRLDLLGQVVVLLAGIFGVVVLFKERGKKQ